MKKNYFERGLQRKSSTIRTPLLLQEELQNILDNINANSDINVTMNDLLTIGNIQLTNNNIDYNSIKKANSLNDICKIIIQN